MSRVLQGYNVDIRHIPRKKNSAESLSRQLIADALVRKGFVKNSNAEYVQKLRVSNTETDKEIQDALHQVFSSSPQAARALKGIQIFQQMKIQALKAQK